MFIIRVMTNGDKGDEIRTFTFENETEMERAFRALQWTTCKGFAAEVCSPDAKRGTILDRWDYSTKRNCSLRNTLQSGPYRDLVYEVYGLKDECIAAAKKTNEEATCWASRSASLTHVAGNMYVVTYTEPYTD